MTASVRLRLASLVAIAGPVPDLTLLVMQATLKCALQRFSASTMRGRRSPLSSAMTSRPGTLHPFAAVSAANAASNSVKVS